MFHRVGMDINNGAGKLRFRIYHYPLKGFVKQIAASFMHFIKRQGIGLEETFKALLYQFAEGKAVFKKFIFGKCAKLLLFSGKMADDGIIWFDPDKKMKMIG